MSIDTTGTPHECTSDVYPVSMPDNLDPIRDELRELAGEFERARALVETRFDLVEKARTAGMTWNEAANLLGMTQNGLIKAQKDMEQKRAVA